MTLLYENYAEVGVIPLLPLGILCQVAGSMLSIYPYLLNNQLSLAWLVVKLSLLDCTLAIFKRSTINFTLVNHYDL